MTNLTDPDSRPMRKGKNKTCTQSYNAQAVVDADGPMLIVGGYITNHANDAKELLSVMASVNESLGERVRLRCDKPAENRVMTVIDLIFSEENSIFRGH